MTSTVLVGTDGSKAATAAERIGAEFAARLKARLLGVSIVEDRFARGMPEDGLGVPPPSPDAMAAYLKSRAEVACRRLAERARTSGAEHTTEVLQGIADDRIVERGQTAPHGQGRARASPLGPNSPTSLERSGARGS